MLTKSYVEAVDVYVLRLFDEQTRIAILLILYSDWYKTRKPCTAIPFKISSISEFKGHKQKTLYKDPIQQTYRILRFVKIYVYNSVKKSWKFIYKA